MGGLLGLLGLLLAFTFGMAGDRFDDRKGLVVEEANAIGTAWLRTDLVPEPMRTQARDVLRAYTRQRVEAVRAGDRAAVERGHRPVGGAAGAALERGRRRRRRRADADHRALRRRR